MNDRIKTASPAPEVAQYIAKHLELMEAELLFLGNLRFREGRTIDDDLLDTYRAQSKERGQAK